MTANDYANIARMIEEAIDSLADEFNSLESDLQNEIQSSVSEVSHDVARLENTISDLEGRL